MALIKCHECGKEVSDSAVQCPHCGCKTKFGRNVTQVKVDIFTRIIIIVAGIVGGFLLYTSWSVLRDIPSYYWRYDEDAKSAFLKLFIGLGLIIGSIVVEIRMKNQYQYNTPSRHSTASSQSAASTPLEYAPVAFIPEDKRKHGPCAKCGTEGIVAECRLPNQFGDFDLCPKCITRYRGQIR